MVNQSLITLDVKSHKIIDVSLLKQSFKGQNKNISNFLKHVHLFFQRIAAPCLQYNMPAEHSKEYCSK